jgi:hypothetical protein
MLISALQDKKHYRNYVLHFCPHLLQLDFSRITKQQESSATTWSQTYRNALTKGSACEDA